MKAQQRADRVEALFESIKEVSGDDKSGSLMLHNFKYTNELDESWIKDTLITQSSRLTLTAKKGGITLFGQEFIIDREPDEEESDE